MCGALGTSYSIDAAVHHAYPDSVPGDIERGPLAPLVGHGVVAAEGAGLSVVLKRQVPATNLHSQKEALSNLYWHMPVQRHKTRPIIILLLPISYHCVVIYCLMPNLGLSNYVVILLSHWSHHMTAGLTFLANVQCRAVQRVRKLRGHCTECPCQPVLSRHSSWDHKPPWKPVNAAGIWTEISQSEWVEGETEKKTGYAEYWQKSTKMSSHH